MVLFFVITIKSNAQVNSDSLKDIAFKPAVVEYIAKMEKSLQDLKKTNNSDSIKIIATTLIDYSGQMESDANKFYGYQPTSFKYGLVIGQDVSYEPILISGNKKPTISSCALGIHDISCGIYWLYNKNPEKRNIRIAKIEGLISVIRENYGLE